MGHRMQGAKSNYRAHHTLPATLDPLRLRYSSLQRQTAPRRGSSSSTAVSRSGTAAARGPPQPAKAAGRLNHRRRLPRGIVGRVAGRLTLGCRRGRGGRTRRLPDRIVIPRGVPADAICLLGLPQPGLIAIDRLVRQFGRHLETQQPSIWQLRLAHLAPIGWVVPASMPTATPGERTATLSAAISARHRQAGQTRGRTILGFARSAGPKAGRTPVT